MTTRRLLTMFQLAMQQLAMQVDGPTLNKVTSTVFKMLENIQLFLLNTVLAQLQWFTMQQLAIPMPGRRLNTIYSMVLRTLSTVMAKLLWLAMPVAGTVFNTMSLSTV